MRVSDWGGRARSDSPRRIENRSSAVWARARRLTLQLYGARGVEYFGAMSAPEPRYAYLHGFRSSPNAKKGNELRERMRPDGIELLLPDLNQPSFEGLSVGAMLRHLDAIHAREGEPSWRIIGSSLGGWLAARWAELHPSRVNALVLLCPAFDIKARWPEMMPAGDFERWRREGAAETEDAAGNAARLHFSFYEEASRESQWPSPAACPVTVIHGVRDETVPVESSRRWVRDQPDATLIEVDDTHDLLASMETIERAVRERFEIPAR